MEKEAQTKTLKPIQVRSQRTTKVRPVERSTRGLRSMLFDEIDLFRRGQADQTELKALSSAVTPIVASFKLELEAAKYLVPSPKKGPGRPKFQLPHLKMD